MIWISVPGMIHRAGNAPPCQPGPPGIVAGGTSGSRARMSASWPTAALPAFWRVAGDNSLRSNSCVPTRLNASANARCAVVLGPSR